MGFANWSGAFLVMILGALLLLVLGACTGGTQPGASLELEREEYNPEDEIQLTLVNSGETTLVFGHPFRLEVREDEEWREIPLDLAWTQEMLELEPGDDYRQGFTPLQDFAAMPEPGDYRLTKTLTCAETEEEFTVQGEFALGLDVQPADDADEVCPAGGG